MARPKQPEDPVAFPHPCARCGKHYQTATTWPDGRVCVYCYRAASRTRGTCSCGHVGILPGIVDGEPACRSCTGVRLNVDCCTCGQKPSSTAATCACAAFWETSSNDALTNPDTGTVAAEVLPMAAALKQMDRPNSGLTWIRQPHVDTFLRELAKNPRITHETLDALPGGHTRDYVRGLLVEHGALPSRDELLARFEQWAEEARQRVAAPEHLEVIDRYIRWKHLRRMRELSPITNGTFLRAKQSTTVAIEFCNWLTKREETLPETTQAHLDTWIAEGPSTRLVVDRFLRWTARSRLTDPELIVPRHRRGTAPRLPAQAQTQALDTVISSDALPPRNRLAAVLVLVFAQQIERIVTLNWEDISIVDQVVVNLAGLPIVFEPPLDQIVRDLASSPGHDQTAAHPNTRWVFRSPRPGAHISAMHLRQQLTPLFSALAARLGTIAELSRETPVAILAEALGYNVATLERHAAAANADYGRYIDHLINQ